mmetsp:Transcript_8701/g.18754  ORF Transcript_8701/g.18754 Transcript_8701/m.18754 type:complete len:211 (+) Transcript_8701:78-710(+)
MVSPVRYLCFSSLLGIVALSSAFQSPRTLSLRSVPLWRSSLSNSASEDAEAHMAENYPSCYDLLSKNGDAMKKINKSGIGFTVFAPNEAAFAELGEKKQEQLVDERNGEVSEKIALYHVILEPVSADDLFNSGGVITEGGEVLSERSVSGGFFGVGGKEDGGVTMNGAKVVKTLEFEDDKKKGFIHETDGFISPSILWRYADQLRIPGTS